MRDKLYSPTQVAVGSFLGGPIAAVYLLWQNYLALDQRRRANQTLLWGTLFMLAIFATLPVLPSNFPNYLIPVAYMVAARFIAERTQMSKQQIEVSPQYGFQSGWRIVWLSVLFLVAFLILVFAWMFGLDALGVISLEDL